VLTAEAVVLIGIIGVGGAVAVKVGVVFSSLVSSSVIVLESRFLLLSGKLVPSALSVSLLV
jgi:hypothetical protein